MKYLAGKSKLNDIFKTDSAIYLESWSQNRSHHDVHATVWLNHQKYD